MKKATKNEQFVSANSNNRAKGSATNKRCKRAAKRGAKVKAAKNA